MGTTFLIRNNPFSKRKKNKNNPFPTGPRTKGKSERGKVEGGGERVLVVGRDKVRVKYTI